MESSENNSQDKIDFFLVTAHELRTSLSALKWLFKMISDGDYGALNDEQSTAITQASQINDRMVTLLNNTMTAIKNNEAVVYTKLPVHLASLMAEIAQEFTNEATEKHIAITYHQPALPIIITGDEMKLRTALHNIIENAIKYSRPESEVIVSLTSQNQQAVLTVQDHGVGIPVEKKVHLFEKFFRAENTIEKGTGLGLYSTKLIIDHHGGSITMESEENKGSTVTITLPLAV